MTGRLIKFRKCKNRVLSVPGVVTKDYNDGLISLKPSVAIYDLIMNKEYFTTTDCSSSIDKKQYDNLMNTFKKRKNKTEISFDLKKKKRKNKYRKNLNNSFNDSNEN